MFKFPILSIVLNGGWMPFVSRGPGLQPKNPLCRSAPDWYTWQLSDRYWHYIGTWWIQVASIRYIQSLYHLMIILLKTKRLHVKIHVFRRLWRRLCYFILSSRRDSWRPWLQLKKVIKRYTKLQNLKVRLLQNVRCRLLFH